MPRLRLNKILAQAGLTSRRGADLLVLAGRVAVNGVVVREAGTQADLDVDDVRLDGRRVGAPEPRHYLLLNKPAGYVTSRHDEHTSELQSPCNLVCRLLLEKKK